MHDGECVSKITLYLFIFEKRPQIFNSSLSRIYARELCMCVVSTWIFGYAHVCPSTCTCGAQSSCQVSFCVWLLYCSVLLPWDRIHLLQFPNATQRDTQSCQGFHLVLGIQTQVRTFVQHFLLVPGTFHQPLLPGVCNSLLRRSSKCTKGEVVVKSVMQIFKNGGWWPMSFLYFSLCLMKNLHRLGPILCPNILQSALLSLVISLYNSIAITTSN